MFVKQQFRNLVNKIPYVKQLHKEIENLKKSTFYEPGHFYSPIVSVSDVQSREKDIWKENNSAKPKEIDFNDTVQLHLAEQFATYYAEFPFTEEKQPNLRFYLDNSFYSYTDAVVLYSMMRHFKPKQIIEMGSGFSSSLMLDTNDLFFNEKMEMTFIEPHPERLFELLTEADKQTTTIIANKIQTVPKEVFAKLNKNDILFIDSSHVVKTGSDVHYILFEILPVIKSGVIVHFHDIFFPFEYPKQWVMEGRSWNESYFLQAFMMYNSSFSILFFSDYLHRFYPGVFDKMPLCSKNYGGNFWLVKK